MAREICQDLADDVFDGDEQWCDITGEHHVCVMTDGHIARRTHECECGDHVVTRDPDNQQPQKGTAP